MQAMFRKEVPIAIEGDGVQLRTCPIGGGMSLAFVTIPGGTDLRPAFKGLPEDLCQCPHWGYVLSGRLKLTTPDGAVVYEAGQAFYLAPGHAPEALEDCEFLDFSPTDEYLAVLDHLKSQGG